MKRSSKIFLIVLALLLISASAFAQEEDPKKKVHTIFIGINPIMWVLSWYQAEVAVPLSGIFEVAAQGSLFWVSGFANTFGLSLSGEVLVAHFGGLIRLFPMQNANGFFFSGRVMVIKFVDTIDSLDLWDIAAGVDLGWRFRWWLDGWGIIFQFYAGVERAITQQQIGQFLPIIPFFEYHLGVCF